MQINTTPPVELLHVVAVAMVNAYGKILMQQRPADSTMAGLWEFPGGKIEPGETPELALVRELEEELGICVDPATLAPAAFASASLGGRHLILLLYILQTWKGDPRPLYADGLQWVAPQLLSALAMPPADYPLAELLQKLL